MHTGTQPKCQFGDPEGHTIKIIVMTWNKTCMQMSAAMQFIEMFTALFYILQSESKLSVQLAHFQVGFAVTELSLQ